MRPRYSTVKNATHSASSTPKTACGAGSSRGAPAGFAKRGIDASASESVLTTMAASTATAVARAATHVDGSELALIHI